MEFDGSPKTVEKALEIARINTETLRLFVHKIKESDYVNRTMRRLNQELSPLKDADTRDEVFIRDMWEKYSKKSFIDQMASKDEIRRNPEKVHSQLKTMESGMEHPDAKVLQEYAEGQIKKED